MCSDNGTILKMQPSNRTTINDNETKLNFDPIFDTHYRHIIYIYTQKLLL